MRGPALFCLGVSLLSVSMLAQTPAATQDAAVPISIPLAPAPPNFVNLSGLSNDYQVGPGDQLDIHVVGQTMLNAVLRISNSGEISYPVIGLLKVADLTTFDVETLIATRLREAGLLQNPDVLVSVNEYQAKPVYVTGAVTNPGEFIMSQELTIADVLLLAGGLKTNAAREAILHRRIDGAAGPIDLDSAEGVELIPVDMTPFKEGRFLETSLTLKRGDVLNVPEMELNAFYVAGEVFEPRNYFYEPGRTLLVSQAISVAGGPMPTADMGDGVLVRYDEAGQRQELKVNYAAILRGEQQDFPIQPHDIIFIPGSRIREFTSGLLGMTDQMSMSMAFRIGRTYQLPDAADAQRQVEALRQQQGR